MQAKMNYNRMVVTTATKPRKLSKKAYTRKKPEAIDTREPHFRKDVSPITLLESIGASPVFARAPRTCWDRFGVAMTMVLTAASSLVMFAASLPVGIAGGLF